MEAAQDPAAQPSSEDACPQPSSDASTDVNDAGESSKTEEKSERNEEKAAAAVVSQEGSSKEHKEEKAVAAQDVSRKDTDTSGEVEKERDNGAEDKKVVEKETPDVEHNPFQIAPKEPAESAAHVKNEKTEEGKTSVATTDIDVKVSEPEHSKDVSQSEETKKEVKDQSDGEKNEGKATSTTEEKSEEVKPSQNSSQIEAQPSINAELSDDQQLVASLAAAAFGEVPVMGDVDMLRTESEIYPKASGAEEKAAGQPNRTDDNEAVAMLLGLSQSESTERSESAEKSQSLVKGGESHRTETKPEPKTPRKQEPGSSKKGKAHHEHAKAKKGQESTPNAKKANAGEKVKVEGEDKTAGEINKSKRERENAEKNEEVATPGKEKDSKKKQKKQIGEQIQNEKTLSREERKMLAYMRQFEEMERRQQRLENPGTPREKHDGDGHDGRAERVESKSSHAKGADVKHESHGSANDAAGQGARGDGETADSASASAAQEVQERSADSADHSTKIEDAAAEDGTKSDHDHVNKHFSHHNTSGANQQWRGTKGHGVRMGNMLKTCYKLTDKQRQAMEIAAGGGLLLLRAFKAGAEKRAPCVRFLKIPRDSEVSEKEVEVKTVRLDAQTWINAAKATNQNRLNPKRRTVDRRKFPLVKRILHLWSLEAQPVAAPPRKEVEPSSTKAGAAGGYRLKHEKGGHLERIASSWRKDPEASRSGASRDAPQPERVEAQGGGQAREVGPAVGTEAQPAASQEEQRRPGAQSVSVKDEIRSFVDHVAAATRVNQPPAQMPFGYQGEPSAVPMDFMAGRGALDMGRDMHLQRPFHDQAAYFRRSAWDQLPTDQPPPYKQENKFSMMHERDMDRGPLSRGYRPPKFADAPQPFFQRRRAMIPPPHRDSSLSPRSREFHRELQVAREHRRVAESLDMQDGKPEGAELPTPVWPPMPPWVPPHPGPMARKERPSMFDSRPSYPKPSSAR
ncbi:hypothetical protein GUITHDRAFT_145291 [Guillardia theta CCMP2712]|uniref:Uncharacterized protein n=1 Tax=Guillardia theta (strain CCMP2712) TaxID=905079 RepID=L1ILP2_GUITC|nr:hypothetical protein GUITHDRAFT_145291 [Guillardia theta CCMP2712]EKX37047.1 hypothetical protein GUITHDRAFT_145291 [Guillardia theta CCMP2712]|eukprot:XP_005824027.1 hypothetical protein GUITHDRAFT_145291 [Guillardia theta CCMP2712]